MEALLVVRAQARWGYIAQ